MNEELTANAQVEAEQVAQWEDQRRQTALMLSEYSVMSTSDPDQIDNYLESHVDELPDDVREVHYVDAGTNEVLASTEQEIEGTTITVSRAAWASSDRTFADAGDVFRSESYLDEGEPAIAFVSPVPNHEDRLVVVNVDTAAISALFDSPVEGGFAQVVDSSGTVVMDEQGTDFGADYAFGSGASTLRRGSGGQSGVVELNAADGGSGEQFLAAYTPIEGTDWVLVVHAPKSAAYAITTHVGTDLAILILGTLAGFALLGLTIGRNTVRSLTDLERKAQAMERGELDETIESERKDEIGRLYRAFGNMRDSIRATLDDKIREANDAAEQAEAERERARTLATHLERKADEYGDVMARCADGDLTERMGTDTENEAMRDIATTFNGMMDELEATIVHIQQFADEVAVSSEEATASVEEVQNASEQVSQSVQEIAVGAERQNEDLLETSNEMSSLSASIEEVAASADQVAGASEQAASRGEDAQTHARSAIEEMTEIERRTEHTVDEVTSLDEEMAQIGDIVEMITDIAEQTNLLALNASIEAARAGEAGDGFAVVADEIKQLAEEAGEATRSIESLIEGITTATEGTAAEMRATGDSVSEGVETVERALDALDDVVSQFDETNQGVQEISDATEDQAKSTEEVVGMVEGIASVSDQTTAEAENVSAASEEQTASLTEVTTSVKSLSAQADELHSLLGSFTVGGQRGGNSSGDSAAKPVPSASTDGGFDFE